MDNNTKIIKSNCLNRIKTPCGQRVTHKVDANGIHEVVETYDQNGETIYAQSKLIMSKEAFIIAYNTYIK